MSSSVLPYVQDTTPTLDLGRSTLHQKTGRKTGAPPRLAGEIISLSYDQVNDDADELVELRGEGRYFGVTDPSLGETINATQSLGVLCGNCHQHGHHRRNCKTVVCHKCGVVGEHYEQHCPLTVVCPRCNGKGHSLFLCPQKDFKRQYCKLCDSFSHSDERCPSIWRLYLTRPSISGIALPATLACYNCGSSSHYGDECSLSRSSRVPNQGSAFSGTNLPRELRAAYFDHVKRSAGRSNGAPPSRTYSAYNTNTNNKNSIFNSNRSSHSNNNSNNNFSNNNNFRNNSNTSSNKKQNWGYGASPQPLKRDAFRKSNPQTTQNLPRKPNQSNQLGGHAIGNRGLQQKAVAGRVAKPTRLGLVDARKGRNSPKTGPYNRVSKMY